jgi:hypothetical protein
MAELGYPHCVYGRKERNVRIISRVALFVLIVSLNSITVAQAEEGTCDWLHRLKAQQPIFSNPDGNDILVVNQVKNPSRKESKQKKSPMSGIYYFLWNKYDAKIIVFVGREYSLELTVPEYDGRPLSAKWINPKLIYINIWFNPHYGAYWIYDVEEEKIVIHELKNDGWDAWQQCNVKEKRKDGTKKEK